MNRSLQVTLGQYSDQGCKAVNQDFHGALIPTDPLLRTKGIVVALADGISSSQVSQIAAETAVKGFLADYYATSEAWSVKTSARRVLQAINSWLHAQNRRGPNRHDLDRGYVCTFSAAVIRSTTAHLLHVGDSRICYVAGRRLEPLTEQHRLVVGPDQSYLSRALGMREHLELDYQTYTVEPGDTLVLMTDGVHEFVTDIEVIAAIEAHPDDLDLAAREAADLARAHGSSDNLTIQILRVDALPVQEIGELNLEASLLPFPPELRPRTEVDGYEIQRELHHSHRSHVYLAIDQRNGERVALKTPSVDMRDDAGYRERFLMEEWVAQRVDSPHLIKPMARAGTRSHLYSAWEFVEGQTLSQWMRDHPEPDLEVVRGIVEQIARGLRALHRQEMLHQDLRPANVLIDRRGTVKLIDFGSVKVAGVAEISSGSEAGRILGTAQYAAPEYFLGEVGDRRSDLFSLGVIAYQMLCGELPYGAEIARTGTRSAQHRLQYRPVSSHRPDLPAWVDAALRKAVHPNPERRYALLSEFVHDLRHPNPAFARLQRAPLLERNPLLFWKGLSLLLFAVLLTVLLSHHTVTP